MKQSNGAIDFIYVFFEVLYIISIVKKLVRESIRWMCCLLCVLVLRLLMVAAVAVVAVVAEVIVLALMI